MITVPVLDIGGTHVGAAEVDPHRRRVREGSRIRRPLRSDGSAEQIIDHLAAAAATLDELTGRVLGVALPGPFDYAAGIGRYHGVAKFDALRDIDLGRALCDRLPSTPARVVFINDAHAFTLGEYLAGAGRGVTRLVGLTLGTGVGSAFLRGGQPVTDGCVPSEGRVDLLQVEGRPLEDQVSRRAILAAYHTRTGSAPGERDVRDLAIRARAGDAVARELFDQAARTLGRAIARWLADFDTQLLVVGGAIARSFDLLAPGLRGALRAAEPEHAARIGVAVAGSWDSVEIGAACHALAEADPDTWSRIGGTTWEPRA